MSNFTFLPAGAGASAPDLRPLHRNKIVWNRESSSNVYSQTLQFSYRNSEPENAGCMRSLIWICI